jgi:hypothetical protein
LSLEKSAYRCIYPNLKGKPDKPSLSRFVQVILREVFEVRKKHEPEELWLGKLFG